MNITSYSDLLRAAKSQSQPQRLLFAFARVELPAEPSAAEQERFAAKQGGTLAPIMCVDKLVDELGSFETLVEESRQTGEHWDIVFISSMSGRDGQAPKREDAEIPLKGMLASIENGQIENLLAFDRKGELIRFH